MFHNLVYSYTETIQKTNSGVQYCTTRFVLEMRLADGVFRKMIVKP